MRIAVRFHMHELGTQVEVRTGDVFGWEASAYRCYWKQRDEVRSPRERILIEKRRGPGTRL